MLTGNTWTPTCQNLEEKVSLISFQPETFSSFCPCYQCLHFLLDVWLLTVCPGNRATSPFLESTAESGLGYLISRGRHQQHSLWMSTVRAPAIADSVCGQPDFSSSVALWAKGSSAWPSWGCAQPCIIALISCQPWVSTHKFLVLNVLNSSLVVKQTTWLELNYHGTILFNAFH